MYIGLPYYFIPHDYRIGSWCKHDRELQRQRRKYLQRHD
jgi:hypothetical protein